MTAYKAVLLLAAAMLLASAAAEKARLLEVCLGGHAVQLKRSTLLPACSGQGPTLANQLTHRLCLQDTWSQDYYGGKPSAAHSSHQPAEVLTTCLRETAFKNCRPRLNNIDAVS
jgi:hypothetical protein